MEGPSFKVSVQRKQLDVRYNCEVVSMRMALIDSYICLPCLCYPVRGTVWKGLAGVALFEKVCHCWWAFRLQKHKPGSVSVSVSLYLPPPISLCTSLSLSAYNWRWDDNFRLLPQHYACLSTATLPAIMIMKKLCDTIRKTQLNDFYYKLPSSWYSITAGQ